MRRTLLAALALLAVSSAHGQSTAPDWKYFGSVQAVQLEEGSGNLPATYLFFDANGVRELPNHHRSVWTKGLDQAQVDSSTERGSLALYETMNKRMQDHYIPPLAEFTGSLPDKNPRSYFSYVYWEAVADTLDLNPVTRVLYEVDCAERKTRSLAMQVWVAGSKEGPLSREELGAWEYAAPESNSGYLVAILCKNR